MVKRWKLFLALNDVGEQAPTLEMVKLFVGFMYTYRQRDTVGSRVLPVPSYRVKM